MKTDKAESNSSDIDLIYNHLQKPNSSVEKLLVLLIKFYLKKKRFAEAIECSQALVSREPGEFSYYVELARVYLESGDKEKAVSCMQDFILKDLAAKEITKKE